MPINRAIVLAVCLLAMVGARAEDASQPLPDVGDLVYKGLVGKALDAVPMDPNERTVLQRTSAVVSGTLTGRSLAVWAGLTNPIFLVAGLVWGLFSASNIKTAEASTPTSQADALMPVQAVLLPVLVWSGPVEAIAEAAR
jgi:hypothetical protein